MDDIEKLLMSSLRVREPTLKEICKRFYITRSTLIRNFRAMYGKSLKRYYLEKKLELAKSMILEGKSVNSVCYDLGYKSITSFSGIFKKFNGVRPSRIKRLIILLFL